MGVMADMFREMWQKQEALLPATVTEVPIQWLVPNDQQPRKTFDPQGLARLAASIQAHGILHPLLVTPLDNTRYRIIAGERRYRAAVMVGLTTVPARILENLPEKELQTLALLENLQRQDLNALEETQAILRLLALDLDKSPQETKQWLFHLDDALKQGNPHNVMGEIEKVQTWFQRLGLMQWRSFVRNRLPLLNLPPELEAALEAGRIKYTTALLLKSVEDEAQRRSLLERAIAGESLRSLRLAVKGEPWHRGIIQKIQRLPFDRLSAADQQQLQEKLQELDRWLDQCQQRL